MSEVFLALDCTGETYSCGLLAGKSQTSVVGLSPRKALRDLPGHVAYLLQQAKVTHRNVTAVGVTIGPGSFTGVRLGVTLAKTVAQACDCGVVGFDTLEILARGAARSFSGQGEFGVALDARRGEVYGASFRFLEGELTVLESSGVKSPADFGGRIAALSNLRALVGSGFAAYPQLVPQGFQGPVSSSRATTVPSPELLCEQTREAWVEGRLLQWGELKPRYHRDADIQVSGSSK